MNRINYLKNIIVLAGICIFCSCNSHEYTKVTIAIDEVCDSEQQSATYEVINKRVASIWQVKEKTDLIDGKFDLTYLIYSGEEDLLAQMLLRTGETYIAEMYSNTEIQSSLDRVYERLYWLMENTGLKPLWRTKGSVIFQSGSPSETYELISVPLQQVSFIDSVFNSCKHFFPSNMSFAWAAKPREGFFDLLALKSTEQPFLLNQNSVKSCEIYNQEYDNGETILDYQEILMELKKEYCDEWARWTRCNIGKNLAIVMDGKVLSYPSVQSEITNGKMGITGDYEINEFLLIKSAILGGILNCKAELL